MNKKSKLPAILVGALIIIFALFLFSGLLNWLDVNTTLGKYWPVLVMFLGLFSMGMPDNQNVGFGILGFGFLLLLHQLSVFGTSLGQTIEPLIFIILALILLVSLASPKKPN